MDLPPVSDGRAVTRVSIASRPYCAATEAGVPSTESDVNFNFDASYDRQPATLTSDSAGPAGIDCLGNVVVTGGIEIGIAFYAGSGTGST